MEQVTGIGGVFFKAKDAAALRAWYREKLGIDVQEWGGTSFPWREVENPEKPGHTVWTVFEADSKYFAPSEAPFMINYRVRDLDAMLAQLRAAGCTVDERIDESEFGRFGWVMDPEGHRIELWQPPEGGLPDA